MSPKSDLLERVFLLLFNLVTLGLMTASTEKTIKIMLWLTFVVIGSVLYLTGIDKVIWLPYLMGIVLYLKALPLIKNIRITGTLFVFLVLFATFILYIFLQSMFNYSSMPQLLVGYKAYLLLWSFAFIVAFSRINESKLLECWGVFLRIAVIQAVVAVLQMLIIVPIRGGNNAWDAVVGTFGGNPFHGGNSGGMAIFLLFVLGMLLCMKKYRVINNKKFYTYFSLCIVPILLAEVKVVIIIIPILVITIYYKSLIRRPLTTLLIFAVTFFGAFMVPVAYQSLHYSSQQDRDLTEIMEYSFGEVSDSDRFYNRRTGEMGRVAAIEFWTDYMEAKPLENWLFGYGLAESRSKSSVVTGNLARQFNFNIDRSSMTVLLWEIGVVGFSLIILILFYTVFVAFSMSQNRVIPLLHRALLEASGAGLVIIIATLPYNKAVIDTPMAQLLMMWCIGVAMYWKNNTAIKV